LYNYGLTSDSAYCESRGGKIYVSSSYADAERICRLEYSDVGKKCSDDNDCEGYCLISDRIYLKEKILELQKDEEKGSKYFGSVNVDKFKQEAKIKTNIEGYCGSRFSYLSDEPEIVIRDGVISLGGRWGVPGYSE
jgi:hypothetical protein